MNKEEHLLVSIFYDANESIINPCNEELEDEDLFAEDDDKSALDAYDIYTDDSEETLDLSGFKDRKDEMLSDEVLYDIFDELLGFPQYSFTLDLADIVMCLSRYYAAVHNNNDYTMNFLKEKDFRYIYQFFKYSEVFATNLLKNYYICKMNGINLQSKVFNNPNCQKFPLEKALFYTDYLRSQFQNCIDILNNHGIPDERAIEIMYFVLTGENVHVTSIEESEPFYYVHNNKEEMIKIINLDIYEDYQCNGYLFDEGESKYRDYILHNIASNRYRLPNHQDSLLVLTRFKDLLYDPALRESNRQALQEEDIKVLKRVNPLFIMERVMLGYENK